MFTIINQQKKLFMSMVEAGLQESQVSSSDKQELKPEEKQSADFDSIKEKFNDAISQYKESKKPLNEWDKNAIIEAKRIAEKQIVAVTQTELKFERQKSELTNYITDEVSKLLGDINDVQTQEKVSTQNDKVLGITVAEKNSRADVINSLSASSKASLAEILKTQNLSDLATQLQAARPKEKDGKESAFVYFAGVSNYWDVTKILEKAWYKTDGFFDNEEAVAVYSTILDYAANQENIKKLDDVQRFQMLIDFDQNGKLSSTPNFVVGELQSFKMAQETLQWPKIDTIMKNLWLVSMDDFKDEMSKNLYWAREKFQRILGSYMERGVKLGDLMKDGGVNDALERQANQKAEIVKSLQNDPNLDKKLLERLSALWLQHELQTVKKAFILEAVWISAGVATGAAASFDIREFTNSLVDSIQFSRVWGNWGASISKNLFQDSDFAQKYDISTTVWLLNFYIPFAKVDKTLLKANPEIKKLFADSVEQKLEVSTYAAWFLWVGSFAWVLFERPNEDDSKTITNMVSQMRTKLDAMMQPNYDFRKLTWEDQIIWEEIKSHLDRINTFSDEQSKTLLKQDLVNGYTTYYEHKLMRAAQGNKLTTVWVGFIGLAGYNWIPTLVAGGERITQEYSTVNANIDEERKTTKTVLDLKKYDIKPDTLRGFDVISLDKKNIHQVSLWDGAQAEMNGQKIYISWNVNSLSVNEHVTTSGGIIRTLVLNGGQKGPTDLYVASEMKKINSDVVKGGDLESRKSVSENIWETAQANLEVTKALRNSLFTHLDNNALRSPKTPWLSDLQKEIFKFFRGESMSSLDGLWGQFKEVIWKQTLFTNPDTRILNANYTNEQKLLILQTIPAVLMKKEALKVNDNVVEFSNGTTIKKYDDDKRRTVWADDMIWKELWKNIVSATDIARKEWYKQNGDSSKYTYVSTTEWVAFSATQAWLKQKVSWLMPYTGLYNLAKWNGNALVDLNVSEAQKKSVVDKLPQQYLNQLLKEVQTKWITVQDNDIKTLLKQPHSPVSFDLAYWKMWECLNDAIILKNIQIRTEGKTMTAHADISSATIKQINETTNFWGVIWENAENASKNNSWDNQSSKPWVEGGEKIDTPTGGTPTGWTVNRPGTGIPTTWPTQPATPVSTPAPSLNSAQSGVVIKNAPNK